MKEFIGQEFDESVFAKYDAAVMSEAEEMVERFDWYDYFEGHEIIAAEEEMVIDLNQVAEKANITVDDALPQVVMAVDVLSFDEEQIATATDWKTGYGADKGLDLQSQINALGLIEGMDLPFARFRRIYPRLPGEIRGTRKVEPYTFSLHDVMHYLRRIIYLAQKMVKVTKAQIEPKVTANDKCVYCPVAYRCPKLEGKGFTPKELVTRMKVIKAAENQILTALKKVAEQGDFYVGDERYGFSVSESYSLPRKHPEKTKDLLAKHNPDLLAKKVKSLGIDEEIKTFLEEELGMTNLIKNKTRMTFKWLNEEELKKASKTARKNEHTTADKKSA